MTPNGFSPRRECGSTWAEHRRSPPVETSRSTPLTAAPTPSPGSRRIAACEASTDFNLAGLKHVALGVVAMTTGHVS